MLEEPYEYKGYFIQPFKARRCGKRNYLVLDALPPEGKVLHKGAFKSLGLAMKFVDAEKEKSKEI